MQGEIRAQGNLREGRKTLDGNNFLEDKFISGESIPQHHHGQSVSGTPRRKLHKDWRMWVAVALMLAAITIYVLSLDDSLP